jgi:regulatory protein
MAARARTRPDGPRGTAKERALTLLAVRWRSREELRRRLGAAGFDEVDVEEALADLEGVGLVEDGRFAREVVRHQAGTRLAGDRAIREALRAAGVSADVTEAAVLRAGDEAERALELATRRAAKLTNLAPEAAYRRLFGLLARRGYPAGVAREASRLALREASDTATAEGPPPD